MPKIIETTDDRFFRVTAEAAGGQFDCIEVKRAKGGFTDKAKARTRLVHRNHVLRVVL